MSRVTTHHFDEVAYAGFGYGFFDTAYMSVYSFSFDGVVIDTAQSNMRPQYASWFALQKPEQVLITHHHEDHTGNLPVVPTSIPAYAHPQCVQIVANPPKVPLSQKLVWGYIEPYTLKPMPSVVHTKHYSIQPIYTPGHAPDHYCFYVPQKGYLFSGDLYVHYYIRFFYEKESMKQQMESLRTLLQLDFDALFCCHNPQPTQGKELLRRKLQFFEQFYGQVITLHQNGVPIPQIMKQMNLREKKLLKFMSSGHLSTQNMLLSAIRDYEQSQ